MKFFNFSIFRVASYLIKELNKYVIFLLVLGPIFGVFQGLFEKQLALMLKVNLFAINGVQINKFLIIYLAGSLMKFLATIFINFGSSLSGSLFSNKVANSIIYSPFLEKGSQSRDLTLLTRNIDYVVNRFFNPFTTFIYATINSIIYIYTIFIILISSSKNNFSYEKLLIAFLIFSIGAFIIKRSYRIGKKLSKKYKKFLYNSTLIAKDLVSVAKETRLYKSNSELLLRHHSNERKLRIMEALIGSIPLTNSIVLEFVIGLVFIILLSSTPISGEIAGIGFLLLRISPSINQLIRSFLRVSNSLPLFNDLIKRVDAFNQQYKNKNLRSFDLIDKNKMPKKYFPYKLEIKNYYISINNKTIRYPNCIFTNGKINLIVGKSGSGKTTFIETLLGVNKNNLIKKINFEFKIKDFKNEEIISKNLTEALDEGDFGYCPQENAILSQDIWSNLRIGTKKSKNQIMKNVFFKTLVTKNMKNIKNCQLLSGGEQKRISILRSLLSSKEILIFDEPTNGLNKVYREEIIQIMKDSSHDRIIVVISHDSDFIELVEPVLIL